VTQLSPFDSPLFLGFERFERILDHASKASAEGYPPYNIERLDQNRLRITVALAGFTADDLAITVEDNQLMIRGKQTDDAERSYLHRGIAARQFQRSFVLAEGIEVAGAALDNGLLHIDLERPEPETRVRRIEIETTGGGRRALPTGGGKAAAGE